MVSANQQFGTFDHAGVAVANLENSLRFYQATLGATAEPGEFVDSLQQVKIRFVQLGGARIELLQPLGPDSHLHGMIRRGIGLYHLCYQISGDIDDELSRLRGEGMLVVSPPKPAIAFSGRRVAFTMYQGMMIELLES